MLKDDAEGQIRSWENGKTDSRDGKCDFDVPTTGQERETLPYSPSSLRRLGVAGDKQDKAEVEGWLAQRAAGKKRNARPLLARFPSLFHRFIHHTYTLFPQGGRSVARQLLCLRHRYQETETVPP